jgi:hypothetical protein
VAVVLATAAAVSAAEATVTVSAAAAAVKPTYLELQGRLDALYMICHPLPAPINPISSAIQPPPFTSYFLSHPPGTPGPCRCRCAPHDLPTHMPPPLNPPPLTPHTHLELQGHVGVNAASGKSTHILAAPPWCPFTSPLPPAAYVPLPPPFPPPLMSLYLPPPPRRLCPFTSPLPPAAYVPLPPPSP